MRITTKQAARGKWSGILVMAGFDAKILNGKHQACPMCGGKDRFRYSNYMDGGEYFCSGCGAGDGFKLIAERLGVQFKQAAAEVDRLLGNDIPEVFQPKIDVEKRRKNLNDLWASAQVPVVATQYLSNRGISVGPLPIDLRGHVAMYNADTGQRQQGMVALIRNKDGTPISIHRTFFDPKAKKIMPPTESITGGSVRLLNDDYPEHDLVIGEGIETTLMGTIKLQCNGMAAISAHGMTEIVVPERFTTVVILADNDRSFTGQAAAFVLAKRLSLSRKVSVIMPSEPGFDFADMEHKGYAEPWGWYNK